MFPRPHVMDATTPFDPPEETIEDRLAKSEDHLTESNALSFLSRARHYNLGADSDEWAEEAGRRLASGQLALADEALRAALEHTKHITGSHQLRLALDALHDEN